MVGSRARRRRRSAEAAGRVRSGRPGCWL